MKNLISILVVGISISLLFSCSSVKVTDSWRDTKTLDISNKNILVVSKTNDREVQITFESNLVKHLNENGFKSIENYVKFPYSDPTEIVEENNKEEVINDLQDNNIDVIIVSQLVDSKKYTKTVTTGEYIYPYPSRYRRYRSFYGYRNMYYLEHNSIEKEGIKYILETLVYDLTQPTEHQLISVITSEVDNPNNLGVISKDFSKSIVKNLIQ